MRPKFKYHRMKLLAAKMWSLKNLLNKSRKIKIISLLAMCINMFQRWIYNIETLRWRFIYRVDYRKTIYLDSSIQNRMKIEQLYIKTMNTDLQFWVIFYYYSSIDICSEHLPTINIVRLLRHWSYKFKVHYYHGEDPKL